MATSLVSWLSLPLVLGGLATTTTFDLEAPFAGLEHARRHPRIETFWRGLPPASDRGAATGIVALRKTHDRRVRIAGGRFVMGSTPLEMQEALQLCKTEPLGQSCDGDGNRVWTPSLAIRAEGYAHEVTLSDFEIDVTEVTVEKYMRCVAASACSPPGFAAGDLRFDRPTYPVTHVHWEDAKNFCTWVGGRLPTEAEWELAARGHNNNTFPWGNIFNPRVCNHGAYAEDPTDARDGFLGLAPVGSFPDGATPTGLLDMAGNAAEWVADWYDRDEQQFGYKRGAQTNPKGPTFGVLGHVIRGGSYHDPAFRMRAASRHASSFVDREVGFRCAADIRQ